MTPDDTRTAEFVMVGGKRHYLTEAELSFKAQLRESFRREQDLKESYRLVAQANSRQQKTISRYYDLLSTIARQCGVECGKCHATTRDLSCIDPELSVIQIQTMFESDPERFEDSYPDGCIDPSCFSGWGLSS